MLRKLKKIILDVHVAMLLALTLVLTINSVAAKDKHKNGMRELINFCKSHSKKECHNMHARIHMKHHGGTKKDFQEHYEKEHRKEKLKNED